MELIIILLVIGIIWLILSTNANKDEAKPRAEFDAARASKEDPQARHLKSALTFARQQHSSISTKRSEQDAWLHQFGKAKVAELDQLSGIEFEEFLAGLFRETGYTAELTPQTGDYGADLIVIKDGQRIAVQAKRYAGSVGVQAVQEALSGMAYYKCQTAWVVTTGSYTANAMELAEKSGVKMIGRNEIGSLMMKRSEKLRNG